MNFEQHSRYYLLCEPGFQAVEKGKIKAFTSSLTLLEVLVKPYQKNLDDLVLKFYSLLTTYPNLNWIDLNPDWDKYFNSASKIMLFVAGISGVALILFNVIKAYRQRRRIEVSLMEVREAS